MTYKVKATNIMPGSFVTDLQIYVVAAIQTAMPFFLSNSPQNMLMIIMQAFEYLKFVLSAYGKGQPIVKNEGDNCPTFVNQSTGRQINVYNSTINFIGTALPEIQSFTSNIGDGVNSISFGSLNKLDNAPFRVDAEVKDLLKFTTPTPKEEFVEFLGRIYRLDGKA